MHVAARVLSAISHHPIWRMRAAAADVGSEPWAISSRLCMRIVSSEPKLALTIGDEIEANEMR